MSSADCQLQHVPAGTPVFTLAAASAMQSFGGSAALSSWGSRSPQSRWRNAKLALPQQSAVPAVLSAGETTSGTLPLKAAPRPGQVPGFAEVSAWRCSVPRTQRRPERQRPAKSCPCHQLASQAYGAHADPSARCPGAACASPLSWCSQPVTQRSCSPGDTPCTTACCHPFCGPPSPQGDVHLCWQPPAEAERRAREPKLPGPWGSLQRQNCGRGRYEYVQQDERWGSEAA